MTEQPTTLTGPQARTLAALATATAPREGSTHVPAASPRQIAHALWPDSPAWERRTNMRGGRNGAVGGTMPMKAATLLWRLADRGLASQDDGGWRLTDAGLRATQADQ